MRRYCSGSSLKEKQPSESVITASMKVESGACIITVMAEVFKDCTAVKQEKGGYTYAYVKAMDSAKALPSANIHFQDADAMLTDMLTELAQGGDVAEILAKWQTQIQNEYNK